VLARPLVESVFRLLGRKGAYALPRISFAGQGFNLVWAQEAPLELLDNPSPIEMHPFHEAMPGSGSRRRRTRVSSPHSTRSGSGGSRRASGPTSSEVFTFDLKWVGCQYPTPRSRRKPECR
jgi:hypothetical protein